MARRRRYLPHDRDATERAVMGLASPPMGLASTPSRPRLTPRRTRRGHRRVRGGRGATSRRGEKPKPSPPAGREVAFSHREKFSNFFRNFSAPNGYLAGIGRRTPRDRRCADFERRHVVCRRDAGACTPHTDARVNVRRASNLLPHDGLTTVRPAPARSTALSASAWPREHHDRFFRFYFRFFTHLSRVLLGLAALDSARIARSRARSDLAGPTRGPERLSTSRALAARARAIPSPS